MKFGVVVFRWAIVVSLVLTFSSLSYSHIGWSFIPDIARGLMHSVSILELSCWRFSA